ncbi:MAG: glycosyltransferase family 2 protein [Candidatus Zixiibacteriota bacterium]
MTSQATTCDSPLEAEYIPESELISVIVPTLNEELRLPRVITRVREIAAIEGPAQIIVADGGSRDRTASLARLADKFIHAPTGKAHQLNRGAEAADGSILFFLHATISLPAGALRAIRRAVRDGYVGGGFDNRYVCHQRKIMRLRRLLTLGLAGSVSDNGLTLYGDNGIFVTRETFRKLGGFADLAIMEDYEFSRRMKRSYRTIRIRQPRLAVSPRRHMRAGLLKTRLQWIAVYALYKIGLPGSLIARLYPDPARVTRSGPAEGKLSPVDTGKVGATETTARRTAQGFVSH